MQSSITSFFVFFKTYMFRSQNTDVLNSKAAIFRKYNIKVITLS